MGVPLTCQEIISRVRQSVADLNAEVWTDTRVLGSVDQALEDIWTSVKMAQRAHLLASRDVPIASMTVLSGGNFGYGYQLPEYMGALERVQAIAGNSPVAVEHGTIDDLNATAWARRPFYVRTGADTIELYRSRATAFRFWYLRRWPPLHHGLAAAGSTSTVTFAASPTAGKLVRRQLYEGSRLQFTSGTALDQIVEITAFDPATRVATFTPTLAAPIVANDGYSMLVPMDGDHGSYIAVEASLRLLESGGNTDYLAVLLERRRVLHERFITSIHQRDMDQLRFV